MNDPQKEAEALTANCTHGMEFAETAEHYADVRARIRACIAYQIMERDEARKRITELDAAVYHTAPGEMMFGGEGWTWKQQARATEDRLKEAEAELARRDKEAADARERVERE